jgi:hypothetical protein
MAWEWEWEWDGWDGMAALMQYRALTGLPADNTALAVRLSSRPQIQVSRRKKEDVRPIFWANRPKSYLYRTSTYVA